MRLRGPESQLDWLAVGSLWMGAFILAMREGHLSLIAGAPTFLASSFWNDVPLLLVTVALLIFLYRQISPPRSAGNDAFRPAAPITADTAGRGVANAPPAPLPTPKTQDRVYVGKSIDLPYLKSLCAGKTTHQADLAVRPFMGKWIVLSVEFADLRMINGEVAAVSVKKAAFYMTMLYFRSGFDRLEMLRPGEQITVAGRIDKLSAVTFELEDCELVES